MTQEEAVSVSRGLRNASMHNAIAWREGANDSQFIAPFAGMNVVVDRRYDHEEEEYVYRLELMDTSGRLVDDVDSYTQSRVAGELVELFAVARRCARNGNHLIEGLLGHLEQYKSADD